MDVLHIFLHVMKDPPYGWVLRTCRYNGQLVGVNDCAVKEVRQATLESHIIDAVEGEFYV